LYFQSSVIWKVIQSGQSIGRMCEWIQTKFNKITEMIMKLLFITIFTFFFFFFKLQTPASFAQSVQELTIALQRTGDPANLNRLRPHLELLANIDPSPGKPKGN
jgi:hypothetical protein